MPVLKYVNKDFFKVWTRDMAYVLGFFAADGNIIKTNRDTHFIAFHSADKEILEDIQLVMESNHKLSHRSGTSGSVYRFQIGSKEMYADLVKLGMTEQKARRLALPTIPRNFLGDFVRGYFDGDGNVWSGFSNKKRKTPTPILMVAFTSGSKDFLQGIWSALKTNGLRGGSLYTSKIKHFSRLTFATHDALKLNEIMYNGQPKLFLPRKKLRFMNFKTA